MYANPLLQQGLFAGNLHLTLSDPLLSTIALMFINETFVVSWVSKGLMILATVILATIHIFS